MVGGRAEGDSGSNGGDAPPRGDTTASGQRGRPPSGGRSPHVDVPRKLCEGLTLCRRRRLARGGQADVYAYRDMRLKRNVVVKVAGRLASVLPGGRQRFLREMRVTERLNHAAIPPVFDCGTLRDGRPFYVLKLIDGVTLHEAVTGEGEAARLALFVRRRSDRLDQFVTACGAVAHANGRGVVHRDLKPLNMMVGRDGGLSVIDWGMAKVGGERLADAPPLATNDLGETSSIGDFLGTFAYMSPEQATGETDRHDARTDVFGLGGVLHFLLTGLPPNRLREGESQAEALARLVSGPPASPRALDGRVPEELDSICRKAMATDPADRYRTAEELAADVRRWQRREPVRAHAGKYGPLARVGLWSQRHPVAAAASLVAGFVLAVTFSLSTVAVSRSAEQTRVSNGMLIGDLSEQVRGLMRDDMLANVALSDYRRASLDRMEARYRRLREGGTADRTRLAGLGVALAEAEAETGRLSSAVDLAGGAAALVEGEPASADALAVRLAYCRLLAEADDPSAAAAMLPRLRAEAAACDRPAAGRRAVEKTATRVWYVAAVVGERDQAAIVAAYRRSLRSAGRWAASATSDLDRAGAAASAALALHKLGRTDEAMARYHKVRGLLPRPLSPEADRLLSRSLFDSVMTHTRVGDHEAAAAAAREGIRLLEPLARKYPLVPYYRSELARGLGNFAESVMHKHVLRLASEPPLALKVAGDFRKAAEAYERAAELQGDRAKYRRQGAIQRIRQARMLVWAGDLPAAAEAGLAADTLIDAFDTLPEDVEVRHYINDHAVFLGLLARAETAADGLGRRDADRLATLWGRLRTRDADIGGYFGRRLTEDPLFVRVRDRRPGLLPPPAADSAGTAVSAHTAVSRRDSSS